MDDSFYAGGAKPFVADPFSPDMACLSFFNVSDTLCCLAPTKDATKVGDVGFVPPCELFCIFSTGDLGVCCLNACEASILRIRNPLCPNGR